jgi:hypothetical protein
MVHAHVLRDDNAPCPEEIAYASEGKSLFGVEVLAFDEMGVLGGKQAANPLNLL